MSYRLETAEYLAANVALGADWLDAELPDWAEQIDLRRLDLGSTKNCVLGQLDAPLKPDHKALGWCFFGGTRLTELWRQEIYNRLDIAEQLWRQKQERIAYSTDA
jgi:hypothetical protein